MSHANMLRFVLVLPKARADGDFRLNDLPGTGGRIDILFRSLAACFDWAVEKWPPDQIELTAVLSNRRVISFRGLHERQMSERAWAETVAMALQGQCVEGVEVHNGTIDALLCSIEKRPSLAVWVLDEEAPGLETLRQALGHTENIFIMGDHNGFDAETHQLIDLHGLSRVSLGSTSYLSSHCIAIVISELERLT